MNFFSQPSNTEMYFAVGNDLFPSGNDSYILRSKYHLSLDNGVSVNSIVWQLGDSTGTALSSDSLPLDAPTLSDWESNYLTIYGGPAHHEFGIGATVTSAYIPEPLTLSFLSFGVLLLKRSKK